jgi:hypothetical protein
MNKTVEWETPNTDPNTSSIKMMTTVKPNEVAIKRFERNSECEGFIFTSSTIGTQVYSRVYHVELMRMLIAEYDEWEAKLPPRA